MMNFEYPELSISDLTLRDGDHEWRLPDVRLAQRLELKTPVEIKHKVEQNRRELKQYGALPRGEEYLMIASGRKRRVKVNYLSEPQALLLCMMVRCPDGYRVRREVVELYSLMRKNAQDKEQKERLIDNEQKNLMRELIYGKALSLLSNEIDDKASGIWREIEAKFGAESAETVVCYDYPKIIKFIKSLKSDSFARRTVYETTSPPLAETETHNSEYEDILALKPNNVYFTAEQVVERWNGIVKPSTLAFWRHKKKGPPYRKMAGRVMYSEADLLSWEQENFKAIHHPD